MNAALRGSDRIWQRVPMARPHMGYRNSAPSALAAAPTPGHNDGVDNRNRSSFESKSHSGNGGRTR